ncbi:prolipoprotein diacylglyceryl transferase [Nanoarchaeota archaeon]
MFTHNIDPVLFNLFGLEIRYYGVVFLVGFIIAYFFLNFLAKERKLKIKKDDVLDLLVYIAVGAVIGARILHVLEEFSFYISNPSEIIAIWHGGLSFYGAAVGAALTGLLFCKKKKIKFYDIADMLVIPLALGLAMGRISNFINAELYGKITDLNWCVNFPNAEGCRHPSQIYESFKNLAIFFVLFFSRNKKLPKGALFWSFITLYSFLRFFMEFFREQTALFLGLSVSQFLAILAFITGLFFLIKKK